MASKRKESTRDENPKKRARVNDTAERSNKKKQDHSKKDASSEAPAPKPAASNLTVAKEDDTPFPRGGASALTPLEHKQINIQAKKDVLFEQGSGAKRGKKDAAAESESEDEDMEDASEGEGKSKKAMKKAKSKKAKKDKKDKGEIIEKGVKIEGLSYKKIVPGTKILGQVTSVNAHDIGLALPNNLTGYVPITAISKGFSEKLEKILQDNGDNEASDDEDEDEDALDLKAHFYPGQYLRSTVTATHTEAKNGKKGKKHIELSIDPREANAGLSTNDMVENAVVQASVVSVEDHGIIMDLGLDDSTKRGFMSKKEIPHGLDINKIKPGSVFLCLVQGQNDAGTVVKLSGNLSNTATLKKACLTEAPTIQGFQPGTAAEILLTDVTNHGMAGKIMGMVDAVVDIVQSGACAGTVDLESKYKLGAKIKGRVVSTFSSDQGETGSAPTKVGFSLLDHVCKFAPATVGANGTPAISSIVHEAEVVNVESALGVYVKFASGRDGEKDKTFNGFVHISRLSDGKVEGISAETGPFKRGSLHEARIIGLNALDNLYLLSFEKQVIDQPFLRLEDVTVGAKVKGKIERTLIGPTGIDGIIVSLADGITGLVPGMHMSDTKLAHPEKRFREGAAVSVRILNVDLEKRQLRLTMKKSLLNTDTALWKAYTDVKPGQQSLGTIVNLQAHGAVCQFYGGVRGFLPVSEMSEAYITDPSQHFTVGQVVSVHCLSVDAELSRLVVSCKDPSTFTQSYKTAFESVKPGMVVSGNVFEKSSEDVLLKLDESGLVARLAAEHLGDHKPSKVASALSRVRVGQKLNGLVVLDLQKTHRLIKVSGKPSLKEAVSRGELPATFEEVEQGKKLTGMVRNITPEGIFVEFLAGLTGLAPKRLVDEEHAKLPDFGLVRGQILTVWVAGVEHDTRRFVLSTKPISDTTTQPTPSKDSKPTAGLAKASNPVDPSITTIEDFEFGRITKARIVSVKDTQINVQLADNIQGRIDISQVFDDWTAIKDRKHPLKGVFHAKQLIDVRVMGIHDARSHKYLPISHRGAKFPVYELGARPSAVKDASAPFEPLAIDTVRVGEKYLGFVNNVSEDCLWVNLSPNVRGRLRVTDISDDLSLVADIARNFPVGSALRVSVTSVDVERNHLDLTAKEGKAQNKMTISDFSKGMIVLGRVTKANERQVLVQLSDTIVGAISLIDMADDYEKVDPGKFGKNDVVRVCIVDVDVPNKRIALSVRPSRVLSSSLPVVDREISSVDDIKVNDIVRGFVKRVAGNGLFVTLGQNVTAYVRVSDLSDSFLKEWQDSFQVDQLVRGRLVLVDKENNKIQMSLKESVLDPNYTTPMTINDLKKGQIVTGKIRKVEDFGAFVVIDGTRGLSGLCHKTEMADTRVEDARKLYEEGDLVKAKVLKVDLVKGRISLGLKASYIQTESDEESEEDSDVDMDSEEGGVELEDEEDEGESEGEDESDGDVEMGGVELEGSEDESEEESEEEESQDESPEKPTEGLVTGGFDWTGAGNKPTEEADASDSDSDDQASKKKKKHKKPEIQVDRTGDLDANGPQTVADYERLLLGEPDSSLLWLKYMAFQVELGEIDKARSIAERALKTITLGLDSEKLNVWVALLNLENTFGNAETLEEAFKRACEYNDQQEIHERLISIYIQSEKYEKADELFAAMLKKKFTTKTPELFVNYASFLFEQMGDAERGRALLPRALQSLPNHTHVETTSKFGQLEYRSTNGDVERGRTVFEGLLSSFPKRVDLWNVLLDLEIKVGDVEQIRRLFRRVLNIDDAVGVDGTRSNRKLKEKQARFFFKKWLSWEEKLEGNSKMVEEVKARAAEYVKALKEAKEKGEEE
ncbi:rRNA biogenesis protein rrp5 [Ascosphaera atra]|nr:rRNA biogenesis protein rrp5 [Ascosphaera atra]